MKSPHPETRREESRAADIMLLISQVEVSSDICLHNIYYQSFTYRNDLGIRAEKHRRFHMVYDDERSNEIYRIPRALHMNPRMFFHFQWICKNLVLVVIMHCMTLDVSAIRHPSGAAGACGTCGTPHTELRRRISKSHNFNTALSRQNVV